MGKLRWCEDGCFSCFRAKFYPNQSLPLQQLPKPKEADEVDSEDKIPEEEDILIIRNINPCIGINGLNHHTSKYDLMNSEFREQLVVRRGQSFRIEITLSRPYDETKDAISFIFTVEDEDKPSHGQGTLIALPLMKRPNSSLPWNVVLESALGSVLTIQITTSPEAVVAKWRMDVDTKIKEGSAYSYSWDTGIFLLFNPWCRRDQVHLASDLWRDESVLSDVGLIWRGTFSRMRPCIWKYDQFQRSVLECALYLVREVAKVRGAARGDPVLVARALAGAVNSVDDEGVVMGNWSEDFSGGTPPTSWLGSGEIVRQYYKKKKPVRYGQCWVFSGVLTTVCRALGIPARTVTNYSSAHDTQNSLTVDYFLDAHGDVVDELNSDSIWNFHVWTEVWMARPDLGGDYGGWQAVDSTPQEASEDDTYKCGPASVTAVKRGEVRRPYDNSFLFAEVNADKIFWKYSGPRRPLKLLGTDTYGIGKLICTKAPGVFEREEITIHYKYPEKTSEERSTMLKALLQSENSFARYYLNEDFNDIHFDFQLRDDVKIGQQFEVNLVMENRSRSKDYTVTATLRVEASTYRGKTGDTIKREKYNVVVKANSVHELKLPVTYAEYRKKLLDQAAFHVSCLAKVEDTEFDYFAEDDFRVRKPDVKIILQDKPVEGKLCVADVYIENPLPIPLKKCEFSVDAPGFDKPLKLKVQGEISSGNKALAQFKFTPPSRGQHTIGAKFVAKDMDDCDGFLTITVHANKETNGQS